MSSYLDLVILRDSGANTDWWEQADGTLEEWVYYCHSNAPRPDVVALISAAGQQVEQVRYSATGRPFAMRAGDLDSDGDVDIDDVNAWGGGGGYDVLHDLDLDGSVTSADFFVLVANAGAAGGWGVLSDVGNRKGYSGYEFEPVTGLWDVRHRWLHPDLGRWLTRDPLGYIDGPSLYEYVAGRAVVAADPSGLATAPGAGGGSSGCGAGGGCSGPSSGQPHVHVADSGVAPWLERPKKPFDKSDPRRHDPRVPETCPCEDPADCVVVQPMSPFGRPLKGSFDAVCLAYEFSICDDWYHYCLDQLEDSWFTIPGIVDKCIKGCKQMQIPAERSACELACYGGGLLLSPAYVVSYTMHHLGCYYSDQICRGEAERKCQITRGYEWQCLDEFRRRTVHG